MHENGKVGFSWHETIMHENGKVRFSWHEKKKRGSKQLVVCGVTHWIKFEDDKHQTNFFGRCNLYIIDSLWTFGKLFNNQSKK